MLALVSEHVRGLGVLNRGAGRRGEVHVLRLIGSGGVLRLPKLGHMTKVGMIILLIQYA